MRAFANNHGVSLEIDEATNRRLLRTIDWHLLPVMCIVYGLNYLDKTTISVSVIHDQAKRQFDVASGFG